MLAAVDWFAIIVSAIVGGLVGVILAGAAFAATFSCITRRRTRRDAHVRWLTARLSMSRASIAFVAAFRALDQCTHEHSVAPASPSRTSTRAHLRAEEAQRARARWHEVRQNMDGAQAAMLVHTGDVDVWKAVRDFDRIEATEISKAIRGDASGIASFTARLHRLDEEAVTFVQRKASRGRSVWWRWTCFIDDAIDFVRSIEQSWSRKPSPPGRADRRRRAKRHPSR